MNMKEVLNKLRAEIERLKSTNPSEYNYQNAEGYIWALDDLLSFIDTLSEEHNKSLEEAAVDFVWDIMENDYYGPSELSKRLRPTSKLDDFYGALAEIFIAGAEWQAGQLLKGSPLPEDTVLFQKGVEEGRRLEREDIMKDAAEGEVHPDDCEIWVNLVGYGYKFNDGDKVRLIVLPKED